jgi:hypothetical protein
MRNEKKRLEIFILLLLCLMIGDLLFSISTDSVPRGGNGYNHKTSVSNTRFEDTLFGSKRVLHNFLNFLHWWVAWPENAASFWKLMSSDGNSAIQNIFGHFVLGTLITIAACAIFPKPIWIFCAGTIVNIFHEYVAEGCYVDPSFIDLWLDQSALVLGIAIFFLFRSVNATKKQENQD